MQPYRSVRYTCGMADTQITVRDGGPLLVRGDFTVADSDGNPIETGENAAFCRCGKTGNGPFCDGSHNKD